MKKIEKHNINMHDFEYPNAISELLQYNFFQLYVDPLDSK